MVEYEISDMVVGKEMYLIRDIGNSCEDSPSVMLGRFREKVTILEIRCRGEDDIYPILVRDSQGEEWRCNSGDLMFTEPTW